MLYFSFLFINLNSAMGIVQDSVTARPFPPKLDAGFISVSKSLDILQSRPGLEYPCLVLFSSRVVSVIPLINRFLIHAFRPIIYSYIHAFTHIFKHTNPNTYTFLMEVISCCRSASFDVHSP